MDVGCKVLDLSGSWEYALDEADVGLSQGWETKELGGKGFMIPGTTAINGVGEELKLDYAMTKEPVRSLRQRFRYVGAAWYGRHFEVPPHGKGKRIYLFLERVMVESRVWVNGRCVGMNQSLSAPHMYDVTDAIRLDGENRLMVRIDNRDVQNIGPHSSAYTDETQTIWNGMVGRIELQIVEPLRIARVKIRPDVAGNAVGVSFKVDEGGEEAEIDFSVKDMDDGIIGTPVKMRVVPGATYEVTYDMGSDVTYWDEFSPYLYTLGWRWSIPGEVGCVRFGMKQFKTRRTNFEVNGNPVLLRGNIDCCVFPLTGHPPMDVDSWRRVYRAVKDHGLNHVRFHSWCPPEAAFEAADELGIYLNIENVMWMDTWSEYPVGSYENHYSYLLEEAERILATYGNHPSFCLFSNGNELNGDFDLLRRMITELKAKDDRFLYTLTTNWDREPDPADDYFAAQSVDGVGVRGQYFLDELVRGTSLHYEEAVSKRDIPVISHEIGQYAVYPDVDEIEDYKGALVPHNFETIKKDLEAKGLLAEASHFKMGSGRLAALLYKAEIEAALRTRGFGGFQLLGLHDFPGQSTATVGLLDSFYESKGIIAPEEFRRFCGPVVPLFKMDKRIYGNDESFTGNIEISHYGPRDFKGATITWELANKGNVIGSGSFEDIHVKRGGLTSLPEIQPVYLGSLDSAAVLQLHVAIEGTEYENQWEVWVYPRAVAKTSDSDGAVYYASAFTPEVKSRLEAGERVVLLADGESVKDPLPGKFFPIFWSPVHFMSKDPCGIWCDPSHPVFCSFPTEASANVQWKTLLEQSVSLNIDHFPVGFKPITTVIPNFFHNQRLTNLFEAKVEEGKLLVCTIGSDGDAVEIVHFHRSLKEYAAGDYFLPTQTLSMGDIERLFSSGREIVKEEENLAHGKVASADSELSYQHGAGKGNDGKSHTYWSAADYGKGHWWQVDLGAKVPIAGTRITFAEEGNYLYAIKVSDDGEQWRLVVNQTGQTDTSIVRFDAFSDEARFVRVVYIDLPSGIRAGHRDFEVLSSITERV
ncbi:sugar-binding domain-containing protein [Rossellomorea sp. FS2]|uniref:sugar-binding domain-containing protein n=1 Tax=Rossellomorea sp. FS2 TaxID=3391447 RepID=UPI003A4D9D6C